MPPTEATHGPWMGPRTVGVVCGLSIQELHLAMKPWPDQQTIEQTTVRGLIAKFQLPDHHQWSCMMNRGFFHGSLMSGSYL